MDPKSTATVASAAVATVEDDPTSTAVVGAAEGGRVERGAQGRSATQDQCNEQLQGVLVKDSYSEERTQKSCRLGSTQHRKSQKEG